MLEEDFRDDTVADVEQRERILEALSREAMRDDRIEREKAPLEEADDA